MSWTDETRFYQEYAGAVMRGIRQDGIAILRRRNPENIWFQQGRTDLVAEMDKFMISQWIDDRGIHCDNAGGSSSEAIRRFHGIPFIPYGQDDSEGYQHTPKNNTLE